MESGSNTTLMSGSGTKLVPSVSYDFFDLANAAGKFSRNPQSKTALGHFFDKLKYLEREWYEFSNKYEQIVRRNEHLTTEYEREKHKAKVFQKRLKFVKENQENVDRLRELHDSIKFLEPKPQSDKEIQTHEENALSVDKNTLNSAKDTLGLIKEMVTKREDRYADNAKKLELYEERVKALEEENRELTQLLKERNGEADEEAHTVGDASIQETLLLKPDVQEDSSKATFKSRLKVHQISPDDKSDIESADADFETPLRTIQTMKSSLSSMMSKVRSSMYSQSNECLEKGDGREVEVLKRIRTEIAKKQLSIKSKMDAYNNLINE